MASNGMMLNAVNGAATNVPVVKNDEIAANAIPDIYFSHRLNLSL